MVPELLRTLIGASIPYNGFDLFTLAASSPIARQQCPVGCGDERLLKVIDDVEVE